MISMDVHIIPVGDVRACYKWQVCGGDGDRAEGQICTLLSRTNRSYIPAFRQTECEHAIGNLRVDD